MRVVEISKQKQKGKSPITKIEIKKPMGNRKGKFSCPVFKGGRR